MIITDGYLNADTPNQLVQLKARFELLRDGTKTPRFQFPSVWIPWVKNQALIFLGSGLYRATT